MSKPFTFRLDAALRQQERREEQLQLAIGQGAGARAAAQGALESMRHELTQLGMDGSPAGTPLDPESRLYLLYFMDRTEGQIQQQRLVVERREQELQELHALLLQAAMHRRALERLRERRLAEFTSGEQQRMDRELDELATMRFTSYAGDRKETHAPNH